MKIKMLLTLDVQLGNPLTTRILKSVINTKKLAGGVGGKYGVTKVRLNHVMLGKFCQGAGVMKTKVLLKLSDTVKTSGWKLITQIRKDLKQPYAMWTRKIMRTSRLNSPLRLGKLGACSFTIYAILMREILAVMRSSSSVGRNGKRQLP